MNEAIFYQELTHEFNRIYNDVSLLNSFHYLKLGVLDNFRKLNSENPGAISNQLFEIIEYYIGLAIQRLEEIRRNGETKAIEMLTEILEKPTIDYYATDEGKIDCFSDDNRVVWKLALELDRGELSHERWVRMTLEDCQRLIKVIEGKLRFERAQIGTGGIIEGSGVDGEYTDDNGITRQGTTYQSNFKLLPNAKRAKLEKALSNIEIFIAEIQPQPIDPVNDWSCTEKAQILVKLFPDKSGYSLAKMYHSPLGESRDTLRRAIDTVKSGKYNPTTLNIQQAKIELKKVLNI